MPTNNNPSKLDQIETAIGLISDGLLYLDQNEEYIRQMMGPSAVDLAARLNAQYAEIIYVPST